MSTCGLGLDQRRSLSRGPASLEFGVWRTTSYANLRDLPIGYPSSCASAHPPFRLRRRLVVLAAGLSGAQAQDRAVPQSQAQVQLSFAPIVRSTSGAVVNVYASRSERRQNAGMEDFFRRFFGEGGPSVPPGRVAELARLRRHRRCVGPRDHQQPRHREHERGEGGARRPARVRGRDRAARSAHRSRGAEARRTPPTCRCSSSAIPKRCRWATSCSPSAIRSASGRRSRRASSRRSRARRSASPTISSSSRPMRPSIRAIPAAP